MPKLNRRSDEEYARANQLINEARVRTLTPDELKEILWILSPLTDSPAFYHDGVQFYFDNLRGLLYTQNEEGKRFYVGIITDDLSSFLSGTGGRGSGIFARFAPTSKRLSIPLPEFPKIPPNVKAKFPELTESWDKWEESVDTWVQYVQNQLS